MCNTSEEFTYGMKGENESEGLLQMRRGRASTPQGHQTLTQAMRPEGLLEQE